MTALTRVQHARGVTLVAYAFRTCCALLLAWPVLQRLASALRELAHGATLRPAEVTLVLEVAARAERQLLYWSGGCLAGYALLAPFVSLAWLCGLARRQSTSASLAQALSMYPRSLALGALAVIAGAASAALACAALHSVVYAMLPSAHWAESGWTSAVAGLTALSLLSISTAHDLARAALTRDSSLRLALGSALRATSPRLVATRVLFATAALACALLAEATARAWPHLPELVLLGAQQSLIFSAVLLRGAWLAIAVETSAGP